MNAGTLTVEGFSSAVLGMDGVWASTDTEWAGALNRVFGPNREVDGPSVIPRAMRVLRAAALELNGTVTDEYPLEPLPDDAVS